MRLLLVLKGAHEIASLCSFCVKTKQNQYYFRNFSSKGNIPQHIKILSCPHPDFEQVATINLKEKEMA